MKILLWLSVIPAGTQASMDASGHLYYRWMETGALPTSADHIVLWNGEDGDPGDGAIWTVDNNRRWLRTDGIWSLDLTRMIVDPDGATQRALETASNFYYARPWWTNVDEDPEPALLRDGLWRRYGGTVEPPW